MMDLNFFQINKKQENDTVSKKVLLGSTAVLGLFIGGTLLYNGIGISRAKEAIADLNAKINDTSFNEKYQESIKTSKEAEAYSTYNNTLNDIYTLITARNKVQPYLLRDISYAIPKEVYLNSINVQGGQVSISARSTSRVAIAEFQHNINKLEFINDSHVGAIASDMAESEVFTFEMTCGLKEEYYNEAK